MVIAGPAAENVREARSSNTQRSGDLVVQLPGRMSLRHAPSIPLRRHRPAGHTP